MNNLAVVNTAVGTLVSRTISAWKPGQARQDFTSTATTYGQLKQELIEKGFDLSNTRVTEGNTQVDLVNEGALLPTNISRRGQLTNDLIIIMTPQTQIKSGSGDSYTYAEARTEIREIYNSSNNYINALAKQHFGNYTHLTKNALINKLELWKEKFEEEMDEEINVTENCGCDCKEPVSNEEEYRPDFNEEEYQPILIDIDALKEGLQGILTGVSLVQEELNKLYPTETPDQEELEDILKNITQ